MAIVKYTNPKTGVQYAYESTACWDPETQRNHPKRTYLGRVDPVTGEIIRTEGKRGRKPAQKQDNAASASNLPTPSQYQDLLADLDSARVKLQELQAQNEVLRQDNRRMHQVLEAIWQQSGEYVINLGTSNQGKHL